MIDTTRKYTSLLLLVLLLSTAAWSDTDRLFLLSEGSYGATVKGGLDETEMRSYYLEGKKGQHFRAHLTTLEDNGYLLIFDDQGRSLMRDLPESVKIKRLDLVLPHSGEFLLQVASKQGDCSYMLEVTLDDPPVKPDSAEERRGFPDHDPSRSELAPRP